MTVLSKNYFIAGQNDPPGQIMTWGGHTVPFHTNGVIIKMVNKPMLMFLVL